MKGFFLLLIAVVFSLSVEKASCKWSNVGGIQSHSDTNLPGHLLFETESRLVKSAHTLDDGSNGVLAMESLLNDVAMGGYDGDDREVRRQKRVIQQTATVASGISARDQAVQTMKTALNAAKGSNVGQIEVLQGFDTTKNPIKEVFWRRINNKGGMRVELLQAVIKSNHLRLPRKVFNSTVIAYMKANLNPKAGDEAGHLVGKALGGLSEKYNLAPQTGLVNRNLGGPISSKRINYWFDVSLAIQNYLAGDKTKRASVEWSVILEYPNSGRLYTGRPTRFAYYAVFRDGAGTAVKVITGSMAN